MSLVNQMLKDLAKRQKHSAKPEIVFSGLKVAHDTKTHSNRFVWILLFVFIVVAFVFVSVLFSEKISSLFRKQKSLPDSVLVFTKQESRLPNDSFITPLPVHPAILTAITFQLQHDTTFLRFLLTENVLYRISTDNRSHYLVITIDNAHLSAEAPLLNYTNSALKGLKMRNEGNDVKIILFLQPGAELKHMDFVQSGQMPELQLDLFYTGVQVEDSLPRAVQSSFIKKIIVNTDYESLYQKALSAAAEGETEASIEQLQSLIKRVPHYHKAREALIALLMKEGRHVEANKILQSGLQLFPDYIPFIALKAKMFLEMGQYQKAYELLKQNNPSIDRYPEYYALLAAVYQRQGRIMQATELYRSLVNVQRDQSKWWIGLGVSLESQGKRSAALIAYMQAKKFNKDLSPELQSFVEDKISTL